MAEEGKPTGKTLTDVVEQLEDLNSEIESLSANQKRSGAQVVKSGKLRGVLDAEKCKMWHDTMFKSYQRREGIDKEHPEGNV